MQKLYVQLVYDPHDGMHACQNIKMKNYSDYIGQ